MKLQILAFVSSLWLAVPAEAQARLYFPVTETPFVSTISFDADWNDNSEGERRKLRNVKGSDALTTGQTVDILEDQANYQDLDRQYVSTRMNASITFTSGVTTITSYVQMREFAATDDVTQCILSIRIVSDDGTTVRATLLAVANYGTAAEFLNTGFRNKQCANGDTVTATYTTVLGDRLVVEVGYQTDGAETTPQAAANWGDNGTDCAQNETDTTGCPGWIEFSNSITFAGEISVLNSLTLTGAGPGR